MRVISFTRTEEGFAKVLVGRDLGDGEEEKLEFWLPTLNSASEGALRDMAASLERKRKTGYFRGSLCTTNMTCPPVRCTECLGCTLEDNGNILTNREWCEILLGIIQLKGRLLHE